MDFLCGSWGSKLRPSLLCSSHFRAWAISLALIFFSLFTCLLFYFLKHITVVVIFKRGRRVVFFFSCLPCPWMHCLPSCPPVSLSSPGHHLWLCNSTSYSLKNQNHSLRSVLVGRIPWVWTSCVFGSAGPWWQCLPEWFPCPINYNTPAIVPLWLRPGSGSPLEWHEVGTTWVGSVSFTQKSCWELFCLLLSYKSWL